MTGTTSDSTAAWSGWFRNCSTSVMDLNVFMGFSCGLVAAMDTETDTKKPAGGGGREWGVSIGVVSEIEQEYN